MGKVSEGERRGNRTAACNLNAVGGKLVHILLEVGNYRESMNVEKEGSNKKRKRESYVFLSWCALELFSSLLFRSARVQSRICHEQATELGNLEQSK